MTAEQWLVIAIKSAPFWAPWLMALAVLAVEERREKNAISKKGRFHKLAQ